MAYPEDRMSMGIDVGGTFTDVVLYARGRTHTFKAATQPDDPAAGVIDAIGVAAQGMGLDVEALLGHCDQIVHSTTRATNAVVTRVVPKTAFITTAGHPDILLLREGGRQSAFDFRREHPDPYVPRGLVREVDERVLASGKVLRALDEAQVLEIVAELREEGVEAVGICLLWSIVNAEHETLIRDVFAREWPECFVSVSHEVSPIIREYRRAIATAIDASLKPLMVGYIESLQDWLVTRGFGGRLYMAASDGDLVTFADAASSPVRLLRSGPALAPVAARAFAKEDVQKDVTIVADVGGTTFDVSVVRGDSIARTTEMWVDEPYYSDLLGLPAIDVRSIGSGGGSIAWVDRGGMLRVGPDSAGAYPGPACYGRGGDRPTVTDAALVLGYLEPETFLGGAMQLDEAAARQAVERHIAEPLGIDIETAAEGMFDVSVEQMAVAVEALTVHQGIDPRASVLVGGGGAAGLFLSRVARRVGIEAILFPTAAPVLAATGGLASQIGRTFSAPFLTSESAFDRAGANAVLDQLRQRCEEFLGRETTDRDRWRIDYSVEARYERQLWEIPVPLSHGSFGGPEDVAEFAATFHRLHETTFGVLDPDTGVETILWSARASVLDAERGSVTVSGDDGGAASPVHRRSYWDGAWREAEIVDVATLDAGTPVSGPAIVESRFTTILIGGEMTVTRSKTGGVLVAVGDRVPAHVGRP